MWVCVVQLTSVLYPCKVMSDFKRKKMRMFKLPFFWCELGSKIAARHGKANSVGNSASAPEANAMGTQHKGNLFLFRLLLN